MSGMTNAPYDASRRERMGMKYNHPEQLYLEHTSILTASVVDAGQVPAGAGAILGMGPRIVTTAGGTNGIASAWEYYNQDPFTDLHFPPATPFSDAVFAHRMYLSAIPYRLGLVISPVATIFSGMGFGSPWTGVGGAAEVERDDQLHMSMRYDHTLDSFSIVVINKWAAAGHRRFTKQLGTVTALGLASNLGIGGGSHWEFEWQPNNGVVPRIVAKVNGTVIGIFTDADAAGDTPCAQIYAQKNANGETIKGAGIFSMTGSLGVASQVSMSWTDLYREYSAHR